MLMNSLRILFAATILFAAAANGDARREESAVSVLQTGAVSLDQAVAMVTSRYGAKVMRANTVDESGRLVHYIRLMSADGKRVWTVRVDAGTGQEF